MIKNSNKHLNLIDNLINNFDKYIIENKELSLHFSQR